jgi:hypothetical protein
MTGTSYLFPADNSTARTVALTNYASGVLVPLLYNNKVWYWSGTTYTSATIATTTTSGFGSSATDSASGAWIAQWNGQLVHYPVSGASTLYTLPVSDVITGCAFVPSYNVPYIIGASGQIYTISGIGTRTIGTPFSGSTTWGLEVSGTTLFTMLATTKQLGTFSLSSSGVGVSGATAIPMDVPLCLAASAQASSVTVGGYTNTSIPTSFSGLAASPAAPALVGVNSSSQFINLYKSTSVGDWALTQSLSGVGNPTYVSWATDGLHIGVSDPISGSVSIYNSVFGNVSFQQSIPVSGAGQIAFVSPNNAIVCQPSQSSISSLYTTVTAWVMGNSIGLSGITNIVQNNLYQAIVSYSSGLAFLNVSPNTETLSLLTQVTLPFAPIDVASDLLGTNCAVGTSGASGFLAIFASQTLTTLISWPGSGNSVITYRGQFAVGDSSVPCLRVFGYYNNTYQQISVITNVPVGINNTNSLLVPIYIHTDFGGRALVVGASATWEYQFVSPWGLINVPNGIISTYSGGFWTNTVLGVNHQPLSITYDLSGQIRATSAQNILYIIGAAGGVASSESIMTYTGQNAGTPLGVSSLAMVGSNLYGGSSLNGALIAFDQTLGGPWIP